MSLLSQQVVFFDCQTSGAAPPKAHIIEMGWSFWQYNSLSEVHSSLIALPEDCVLSPRIEKLTGITQDCLLDAPTMGQVWKGIFPDTTPLHPLVIHFARFEKPFLAEIFDISAEDIFCTYEIARRIYPDLPSRSIRAISGFLGYSIENLKRSSHHVVATRAIWEGLVPILEERFQVKSFADLKEWLKLPPEKKKKNHYPLESLKRLALPDRPGVYKFLNSQGRILYVGKATSLKSRVNSYFRGQKTKGSRLNELRTQIVDVEVIEVHSPLQAAIVETDTIKNFNPPYNSALKQDSRVITYCDRDFCPQEGPGMNRLGPFSSLSFVELVKEIRLALESGVHVTGWPFEISKEVQQEGLAIYRQDYLKIGASSLPPWRRILTEAWVRSVEKARQRRREKQLPVEVDLEIDEDIEGGEDEDFKDLHPEDVANYIAGVHAGFARRIHRSRWLNALTSCQLFWKGVAELEWHVAEVKRGVAAFDGGISVLPKPKKFAQEKLIFDVPLYDRMQVLYCEVRRLLREQNEVRLYMPGKRVLSERQLRVYMYPGDFDEED